MQKTCEHWIEGTRDALIKTNIAPSTYWIYWRLRTSQWEDFFFRPRRTQSPLSSLSALHRTILCENSYANIKMKKRNKRSVPDYFAVIEAGGKENFSSQSEMKASNMNAAGFYLQCQDNQLRMMMRQCCSKAFANNEVRIESWARLPTSGVSDEKEIKPYQAALNQHSRMCQSHPSESDPPYTHIECESFSKNNKIKGERINSS